MALVTSATLIQKVKNIDDHESWTRFHRFYSPLILGFSRQKGCNDAQANDILQETLVMLLSTMPKFQYAPDKGKFRSFLLKIVDRRIKTAYRRGKKYTSIAEDENGGDWLLEIEDTSVDSPCNNWDQLWEYNLIQQALERLKDKINPQTLKSFTMYVLEEKKADDGAKILNIDKNTIFQHKNRVLKLLKEEILRLKQEFGED